MRFNGGFGGWLGCWKELLGEMLCLARFAAATVKTDNEGFRTVGLLQWCLFMRAVMWLMRAWFCGFCVTVGEKTIIRQRGREGLGEETGIYCYLVIKSKPA